MKQATYSPCRVRWSFALAAVAVAVIVFPTQRVAAQVSPTTPSTTGFSKLRGTVMDSIHNVPLEKAHVAVEGTSRTAVTNVDGQYTIDSIPAGPHRVFVLHPLLDTIGVQMRTPAYPFAAGQTHDLDLAIPGGER